MAKVVRRQEWLKFVSRTYKWELGEKVKKSNCTTLVFVWLLRSILLCSMGVSVCGCHFVILLWGSLNRKNLNGKHLHRLYTAESTLLEDEDVWSCTCHHYSEMKYVLYLFGIFKWKPSRFDFVAIVYFAHLCVIVNIGLKSST